MDVVKMYKDLNRKPCETMAQAYTRGYKAGHQQGRADAKKEINKIMDMDAPISNVLCEIDKWLKEQK